MGYEGHEEPLNAHRTNILSQENKLKTKRPIMCIEIRLCAIFILNGVSPSSLRIVSVWPIDKLVNPDRLIMTKCVKYFQAKIEWVY